MAREGSASQVFKPSEDSRVAGAERGNSDVTHFQHARTITLFSRKQGHTLTQLNHNVLLRYQSAGFAPERD